MINFLAEAESKSKRGRFINYRDSKLTHLLKDSLGGNSRTVIICTLNPNQMAIRETLSTLKFAERAKKIKNRAIVNEENNERVYEKKYLATLRELTMLKHSLAQGMGIPKSISMESTAVDLKPAAVEAEHPASDVNFSAIHDDLKGV